MNYNFILPQQNSAVNGEFDQTTRKKQDFIKIIC